MGSLVALARATQLVPRPPSRPLTAPRQLDLVLDDVVLQGMTAAQRQAAIQSLDGRMAFSQSTFDISSRPSSR